jgi:hypothetical protein
MSLRTVPSSGVSSGTSRTGEPIQISTNPPGLAGPGESIKDAGGHLSSDDEVPFIVIMNVGESRPEVEGGRVKDGDMHMFAGSTSTEVEGGTSNIEEVEEK